MSFLVQAPHNIHITVDIYYYRDDIKNWLEQTILQLSETLQDCSSAVKLQQRTVEEQLRFQTNFAHWKLKKHDNGLVSAWRINHEKQEEHAVLVGLHEKHPVYCMRDKLDSAYTGKASSSTPQVTLVPSTTGL